MCEFSEPISSVMTKLFSGGVLDLRIKLSERTAELLIMAMIDLNGQPLGKTEKL